MSKQNPAVLDRMYSSPSSPHKEQLYKTVSPFVNHNARLNGSGIVSRSCRSPLHASLLKQTLGRVRRNTLPGQSSLVHMAVHGSQRHYDSVGVSPVIVKLSSPDNKEPTDRGRLSRGLITEASSWENGERMSNAAPNPCDKTVILSALKQKRWVLNLVALYPLPPLSHPLSSLHLLIPVTFGDLSFLPGNAGLPLVMIIHQQSQFFLKQSDQGML